MVFSIIANGLWLSAIAIILLLLFSAFFSGSETALTAASRAKLRSQADKGSAPAKAALDLTEDGESLIGAILIGNNLVNILATSLATSIFTKLVGENGIALATLVMTVLVVIFAEVLPKTLSITYPETVATRVAPIIALIVKLLSPVLFFVSFAVRGIMRLFGHSKDQKVYLSAAVEEIAGTIELHHSEGGFEKDDRDRLLGALDLKQRTVDEIMRHRSDIEMIDADSDPASIVDQCLNSSHTRLPVFKDDPENIIGIIHAKDLLRTLNRLSQEKGDIQKAMAHLDVRDVAMEPYFVPDTTTLDEQMREFLKRHTHFSLVIDEYGSLQGLVTLEDILEEIVGEISDEHDIKNEENPSLAPDGSATLDGIATIRDINRAFGWNLPDDEANTIAGLVMHEAQTIPNPGQVFTFHGYRFEVLSREQNRLTQIRIRPMLARTP